MEIRKLTDQTCPIRELWPKEERNFSPWLANHLDEIGDITQTVLKLNSLEERVGIFEADIFATDLLTNKKVVIENQFGKSNHDHLGKCITYMSNLDADIVIWISETFNEEHIAAIKKLNENTNKEKRFYAIHVDSYKVGDIGLYQFVVEAQPDELSKDYYDNKHFKTWVRVQSYLPKALQNTFEPWTRSYYDFRNILPKELSKVTLSMSVNRKGNHVYLFTYDKDVVAKLDEKLKGNALGLRKHSGAKNQNLTLWSKDQEGDPDPKWLAQTFEDIFSFLNK